MSKQEKIILAGLSLLLVTSTLKAQTWETYPDTWVAVDELGRNVARNASDGRKRCDGTSQGKSR